MVQKRKKTQRIQSVIVRSVKPSSFTKPASFRILFPRPVVATVLHLAVFVYVDAQLRVGQAVLCLFVTYTQAQKTQEIGIALAIAPQSHPCTN